MDPQSLYSLYSQHIKSLRASTEAILSSHGFEALLIGAGQPTLYYADDYAATFKPFGHFSHWCPERSSGHLVQFIVGKKPRLLRFAPEDFWHEHSSLDGAFWRDEFEIVEVNEAAKVWDELVLSPKQAFIGQEEASAAARGLTVNPAQLLSALDWQRCIKTPYEVACISEANRSAAAGHSVARRLFSEGASELEIHHAYVQALNCCEHELPYSSIVGIDSKGAVLHYQNKRREKGGSVLLIDAGARYLGYASDITRTYVNKQAKRQVDAEFCSLLLGMDKLQQELCALIKPQLSYLTLHEQAHHKIAALLLDVGVIKNCTVTAAVELGLSRASFPHGLGHMLGLQVHDVGGLQKNAAGEPCDRSEKFPHLRTARELRLGEVITVEPGLYFIPLLLQPLKNGPLSSHLNWPLIERLQVWGGIRVEDDVYVDARASRNLTREVFNEPCLLA